VVVAGSRAWSFSAAVCTAALLLSITGCISPAFNPNNYRQQALESITASESELQTTRIVLEAMLAHRILEATADEVVSASESAVGSIASSFGAVQPPVASARVERRTMRYLSSAQDAVRRTRIAVRQGDPDAMRLALERVESMLDRARLVSEQLR
jgi:hypothetical protein